MAIRRNPGFDVFNVRLLVGLEKMLREKRRYQGDLSASINDALLALNLNTVKLVTLQGKRSRPLERHKSLFCVISFAGSKRLRAHEAARSISS